MTPKTVMGKKSSSEPGTEFLPRTTPCRGEESSLLAPGSGELGGAGEETLHHMGCWAMLTLPSLIRYL